MTNPDTRLAGGPAGRVLAIEGNARRARRRRASHRRGVIFLIALAVITILSALLLVYAQEMRTEATASANQLASVRADAVEMGAEQWVLAQVETFTTPLTGGNTIANNVGFGQVDITQIPAAGVQVGDPAKGGGYFWCLSPIATDDQTYGFGIQDEAAKANLSIFTTTNSATQLLNLPGMTQEAADSIVDWVDLDENSTNSDGAESSYYLSLGNDAYQCKNGNLDSVEELLLVKGVTPSLMYGMDLNRDGVIDATEQQIADDAAPASNANGFNDRRGIFNYITSYTTTVNPAGNVRVRSNRRTQGLVNINTASEPVLMTLPTMTQGDAETLISQREQSQINGATTTTSWAQSALQGKWAAITNYVTGTSYQYSADIVAVSGDGRAYKRVRIVVDARSQPAKILYRKDLTNLGWPLPADVRTSLRAGQGVPVDAQGVVSQYGTVSNSGTGMGTGMSGTSR